MGQSWTLVNFSSKKSASPHAWGCGYKLSEFAYSFDTFAVLYELLARKDMWGEQILEHSNVGFSRCGSRVAFVGELTESPEGKSFETEPDYSVFCETNQVTAIFRDIKDITRGDRNERQIDPTSLPEKVAFVNHSKHRHVVVDTRSFDAFTGAALVWFLSDASSAFAREIGFDDDDDDDGRGDSRMLRGVGAWAYDTIAARPHDETFIPSTLISDDQLLRDVAVSLRQNACKKTEKRRRTV